MLSSDKLKSVFRVSPLYLILALFLVGFTGTHHNNDKETVYPKSRELHIVPNPDTFEVVEEIKPPQPKDPLHRFSDTQKDHLIFACEYGKTIDVDNEDMCYIFSALIWQESGAGLKTSGGKGHIAYGVFQNYLPTVRSRMKQKGLKYTDSEIIKLLSDRNMSAIFAEEELMEWLKHRKGDMYKALASYYAGWKWENGKGYANSVMKKAKYLKEQAKFLAEGF